MTDRPTPEQTIIDFLEHTTETPQDLALSLLGKLDDHGYVVIHPDDVPPSDPNDPGYTYNGTWGQGWNACRCDIFGGNDD